MTDVLRLRLFCCRMKVVVLAAGFATRLYPLTRDRAKPLLDVAGQPVLSRLLDRLLIPEVMDEVVVVTNERFVDQFKDWAESYACALPLRVLSDGTDSDETKLGAIADMQLAIESIEDQAADLLVVAGDNLIDFDVTPHVQAYLKSQRPRLLIREIEGVVPPRRYNEVQLGEGGRVTSFREKPEDPQGNLCALCLYLLPGTIRAQLAEYLSQKHNHDAPGYFLEWLHGRLELEADRIDGAFHDIGNLETLESARSAFENRERGV